MSTTAQRRAAALAVVVALSGCTAGDSDRTSTRPPSPTDGVTVVVTGTEFAFEVDPRDGLVPATYSLVLGNSGEQTHALSILGPGVEERTPLVPAGGEPVEVSVNLQPGTYELWCPVGDHRARGMETLLAVEAL